MEHPDCRVGLSKPKINVCKLALHRKLLRFVLPSFNTLHLQAFTLCTHCSVFFFNSLSHSWIIQASKHWLNSQKHLPAICSDWIRIVQIFEITGCNQVRTFLFMTRDSNEQKALAKEGGIFLWQYIFSYGIQLFLYSVLNTWFE